MGYLLAYAYLAQISIIWWYVAVSGSTTPQAVMFFSALALVTSGLYLAGHHLHTRFGHLDMDKMGGIAHSMPRFATILVVLITAAMGLPVFAVFSAFFEMMLHVSTLFLWSMLVILLIWLMMSWLYPRLMHQVLFGRPLVPAFSHRDLSPGELLPLILVVVCGRQWINDATSCHVFQRSGFSHEWLVSGRTSSAHPLRPFGYG